MHENNRTYNTINIPNVLSILRIILSVFLYFMWEYSYITFSIILITGFTDVLDGYIARKFNQNTLLGAWLDTIADFIFFISIVICTIIYEIKLIMEYKIFVIIIISIKLLSIMICLIKYKKLGFLHTLGNKIT